MNWFTNIRHRIAKKDSVRAELRINLYVQEALRGQLTRIELYSHFGSFPFIITYMKLLEKQEQELTLRKELAQMSFLTYIIFGIR